MIDFLRKFVLTAYSIVAGLFLGMLIWDHDGLSTDIWCGAVVALCLFMIYDIGFRRSL